jgi:hypothetical protein
LREGDPPDNWDYLFWKAETASVTLSNAARRRSSSGFPTLKMPKTELDEMVKTSKERSPRSGNPNAPGESPNQTETSGKTTEESKSDKKTASELAREFRWFEILPLVINSALAIIGIGALIVYNGQLRVMQGQLDQMKGRSAQTDRLITESHHLAAAAKSQSLTARALADAANKQNDILGKNFMLGQRAWIGRTLEILQP